MYPYTTFERKKYFGIAYRRTGKQACENHYGVSDDAESPFCCSTSGTKSISLLDYDWPNSLRMEPQPICPVTEAK